jgi:hypothetical protein
MWTKWNSKTAGYGLGVMITLAAGMAGCGGGPSQSGDAVVVPDPSVVVSKKTSAGAAPADGAVASTAAPAGAAPAAASSAPVKAEGWGTLKGQVIFNGTAPTPKVLVEKGKADKNPEVCGKDASIISERLVVDPSTKGVKFALVYFPKPTAVNEEAKKAAAAVKVTFDQKGCIFEPHVLALMSDVPITLKSSDSANHNVNAKLKNSTFNQTLAGGQAFPFTPKAAERTPGSVVCDIHPWMTAWWMVLDHPYFAVTDATGHFEIKNVPAGTQKVVVWQEAAGFVTPASGEDVTVKAGDATVKDFTIDKVRPDA